MTKIILNKYILLSFLLNFLSINVSSAQSPDETVSKFATYIEKWCKSQDNTWNMKIEEFVPKGCRVDNLMYNKLVENPQNYMFRLGPDSYMMDSYLVCLKNAISDGLKFNHGTPSWLKDYKEPEAYKQKDEEPLYFVSLDYDFTGSVNVIGADMYMVRGNQIWRIENAKDNNTISNAIGYFSKGNYEKSYEILRNIVKKSPADFDAQYYLAVLEVRKNIPKHINGKFRDLEAAWLIMRGAVASKFTNYWATNKMVDLMNRFNVDVTQLPYYNKVNNYDFIMYLMTLPIYSQGLMVYKNKNGKHGYIDESGNIIIQCKYDLAFPFNSNGLAKVVNNDKTGYINKKGETVIPLIYDDGMIQFNEGRTYVISEGNLLLIDENGTILANPGSGYERLNNAFVNGNAYAYNKISSNFGIYNTSGKLLGLNDKSYYVDYVKGCYILKDEKDKIFYEQLFWE